MVELVLWDNAKRAIAEAKTVDELKSIRDKAEALRLYAKQVGESLAVQNDVAEIKLRAERRIGEMLRETELNKGALKQGTELVPLSNDTTTAIKLTDVGLSRDQSSRYQSIAALPEEQFEQHIAQVKQAERELTEAGVIAFVKKVFKPEQEEGVEEREESSDEKINVISRARMLDHALSYLSEELDNVFYGINALTAEDYGEALEKDEDYFLYVKKNIEVKLREVSEKLKKVRTFLSNLKRPKGDTQ